MSFFSPGIEEIPLEKLQAVWAGSIRDRMQGAVHE
jgi:hypothetical protein